jgi:hypothetical protein
MTIASQSLLKTGFHTSATANPVAAEIQVPASSFDVLF